MNRKEMIKDYNEFMDNDERLNPAKETLFLKMMQQKMAPTFIQVLPKFLIAQLSAALATLAICPQFGLGPIGGGHGIGHFFMRFGEAGCAAFCGMVFLSFGTLVAMLVLRPGEINQVFAYVYRLICSVALLSFALMMWIGKGLELPMLFDGLIPNM